MLKNFKTYQLALSYYRECEQLKVPFHLRDQMLRASSSIVLNIAEGSAKPSKKDQKKFYAIALGSLRECESIRDLSSASERLNLTGTTADQLGACLYRLSQ